jgi:iron complex outermembrane receptor protein
MRISVLLYLVFFNICSFAQQLKNDTIELSAVRVSSLKIKDFSTGTNLQLIDSLTLLQYHSSSLADILKEQTSVYIKSYGQGSLATVSLRGTSSSHTGIFWNGFNINAPNLGMTDLALIPVCFFNNIKIHYGGESSVYGNGIIGGSIHLNNQPEFEKHNTFNTGFSAASFDNYSSYFKTVLSDKKWYSSTSFVINKFRNDFSFVNTAEYGNPVQKQKNAALFQYDIMQQTGRKISKNQILKTDLWYQFSNREIPATMTMSKSDAYQIDKSLRSSVEWEKIYDKGLLTAKTSYINEQLHYVDYIINIDSKTNINTFITKIDGKRYIWNNSKLNLGADFTVNIADIQSYNGLKQQNQAGVFLSYIYNFKKINWASNFSVRNEFIQGYNVPVSPFAGIQGRIWKFIYGKANISKNFRVPTLNDRFWQPGGNEYLKPETSWNEEAGIIFKTDENKEKYFSKLSFTLYNSLINDWIVWQPVNSEYWAPKNMKKVWSRGLEIYGNTHFDIKNFKINILGNYCYSLSTNENKISNIDAAYKKQLIYIPIHKASGTLRILYKNFKFSYNQSYTGKRYVESDNTKYLPYFSLCNLMFSYKIRYKKHFGDIQFDINNLFNIKYQSIQWRPMPGIWYRISLNFKLWN